MKIHTFPCVCDICGGEGAGTIGTAAASWDRRSLIHHDDPRVCASYLARERERLERERREAA